MVNGGALLIPNFLKIVFFFSKPHTNVDKAVTSHSYRTVWMALSLDGMPYARSAVPWNPLELCSGFSALRNGLGFVFSWPQEHLGEEQGPGGVAVPKTSVISQMFMTEK